MILADARERQAQSRTTHGPDSSSGVASLHHLETKVESLGNDNVMGKGCPENLLLQEAGRLSTSIIAKFLMVIRSTNTWTKLLSPALALLV